MRLKLVPNETTINFFGKSNVFFGVSIFAVILSFITYIILGLNFGIDFKGGTSIRSESKVEIEIADNVTVEVIRGTGIQSLMNSQEVKK